jgi:arabinogalactan oligomer/maltooligosaccharide transport system substrate-binding protein
MASRTALIAGIIIVIVIIAGVAAYLATRGGKKPATTTPTTVAPATTATPTPTTPPPTTTTKSPTTTTTTTTAATPSPTTTTITITTTPPASKVYTITIGTSKIRVSKDFYDFVQKVKKGEIHVTINFWTSMMPFEVKVIKQSIAMFEKEYPGIEVKYSGTVQNLKEAVKAAVVAGDVEHGPHVFTWAHDWTGELAEGGYIIALDKYLPPETIEDLQKQYLAVAYSAGVYKLHLYGLPWAAEALALICNADMVKGPIKTFSELEQIMKQHYNPKKGTYGLAYQIDPYHVYPFVTAFGGYYYDEEKDSVGVNSTGTVEGIKFFLSHVLVYMDTSDLGHETQLKDFIEGKAPCIITGPWDIPAIKEAIPHIFVQAIPPINGKIPKPFSGIKLMWITSLAAKDKNKLYASILFALWFTLDDNNIKMLVDKAGFIPVKKSIVEYVTAHMDKYPIVAGFLESIRNSIPMPKSPKMAKVWGPVTNALDAIITTFTEKGLEAALKQVKPTLDKAQADILKAFKGG